MKDKGVRMGKERVFKTNNSTDRFGGFFIGLERVKA